MFKFGFTVPRSGQPDANEWKSKTHRKQNPSTTHPSLRLLEIPDGEYHRQIRISMFS